MMNSPQANFESEMDPDSLSHYDSFIEQLQEEGLAEEMYEERRLMRLLGEEEWKS